MAPAFVFCLAAAGMAGGVGEAEAVAVGDGVLVLGSGAGSGLPPPPHAVSRQAAVVVASAVRSRRIAHPLRSDPETLGS